MESFDHVVVGAGVAADAAARGVREVDPDATILVVGPEPDPPYDRPPLTKDLWRPDPPASIDLGTAAATGATVRTGRSVTALDTASRTVTTDDGAQVRYDRLVLATGGAPRTLTSEPVPGVLTFRSLGDYRRVRELADAGRHVVVVGGGYIGIELACGLALSAARVTLVVTQDRPAAHLVPPMLVDRLEEGLRSRGVEILTHRRAVTAERGAPGAGPVLVLDDATWVESDAIVVGLGITPADDLARSAGLDVDDGVVVDATLLTSDPYVRAAGDVARYPDPVLGRVRVEHVDNAHATGRSAGRANAAERLGHAAEPHTHTPFFYSDWFDDGWEAVGTLDARLTLVEDWAPGPLGDAGVIYHVSDDGALRGVMLWNVWDSAARATELLAELGDPGSVPDPSTLRGRIPLA
ncbi:NAD(P)/FAD-dependent oxidoreductase [Flavimobilis sp. GY10621]|uniref:NAD(P)/FAD-dependent oxidoreductase n=1 Tax=Flavimobilis rhizosphaerae TaxID=2775421 RepID=A0ABR9DRZ5_9MICO|nr:FAD/NAD(P)-binding oxidoreductase [Flavimobilis rhizosphaerae]MBD9699905.1 NAD(P)/FAD-dependent oxidoreductase [Flavimobilis rhizosphaerae]